MDKDNEITPTPETETENLTPEQFMQSVAKMFRGIEVTEPIQKAATATIDPATIESKAVKPEERKAAFVDPLRKSFEALVELSPAYRRLADQAVMDNPHQFLSQKGTDGKGHVVTIGQLEGMMQALLQKGRGQNGVPLEQWLAGGGQKQAIEQHLEKALQGGFFGSGSAVAKALDTTLSSGVGGGALVRTDLEPFLYEAYLRSFPALEILRTFPSNGVVHSYDVRSALGNAVTVSELGDMVTAGADATSTIERRANANIAIIVSRRGLSLKLQFAVPQSGMSFPVAGTENLEVTGGITAIAKKNQALFLQGNYSTASKVLDDEEGLTDTNGYDGLRTLLKAAGTSKTFATGETHRQNLNKLIAQISNAGGNVSDLRILLSWGSEIAIEDEMDDFVRIIGTQTTETGVRRNIADGGFRSFGNILSRFLPVPMGAQAEGMGYYTLSSVVTEDMFVVDPQGMGLAFLGSPSPVILELPVGFDNKLQKIYIMFLMNGLVVNIPTFHRKYRIPRQIL